MKNQEIKQILLEKGITHLYHVNYVITSLTFLNNGGLLSRGAVEAKGLSQIPQQSDEQDRLMGVYYDIFFDSVDIHERAKKANDYGPVTFVYSIDLLDSLPEGTIGITKENPMFWDESMSEDEKYFLDISKLRLEYNKGTFSQHITLLNQTEPLCFDFLKEIIIDDPGVDKQKYFDDAYLALYKALDENGINIPLIKRECPEYCKCKKTYNNHKEGYTYYRFRTN